MDVVALEMKEKRLIALSCSFKQPVHSMGGLMTVLSAVLLGAKTTVLSRELDVDDFVANGCRGCGRPVLRYAGWRPCIVSIALPSEF